MKPEPTVEEIVKAHLAAQKRKARHAAKGQIGPVKVWNKLDACCCGCHGRDPWHKASYRRVITLDAGSETSGTVMMPYSTRPVRVFRDALRDFWMVDRTSIVFDKG